MKRISEVSLRIRAVVMLGAVVGSTYFASFGATQNTPQASRSDVQRLLTTYSVWTSPTDVPAFVQPTSEALAFGARAVVATDALSVRGSNGFRDNEQIMALPATRPDPTATQLVVASLSSAPLTATAPLTPTAEPPIMTPEEIAAAEVAMRDGQARMSRARTQFRFAAIARAEQEVAAATKHLEQVRAEHVKQEDMTAAEAELRTAQTNFERVRLENVALTDVAQAESDVAAAEERLRAAQAQTGPDPAVVASAEARLETARQHYVVVADTASARTTAADQVMQQAAATFQQLQEAYNTSVRHNDLAQQSIDPVTGKQFAEVGLDPAMQRQHYALAMAAAKARMDEGQTLLNQMVALFEQAKAQEATDVAAAQAAVDQAQAELLAIPQGADPASIAQAQQEVDAAHAHLAQVQQTSPVLLEAQQRVAAAQEKLAKLQADWAVAEPVIAKAQKRLDEANTALTQARQSATGNGGWSWPTYGVLTSGFGKRDLKVNAYNDGLDIANEQNTPIGAARAGVIVEAGWCKGYGFCVKIDHGGGFSSEYGHLASEPLVKAGDSVAAGTIIGLMGTTYDEANGGYSTGVHLHFTIRSNGYAVDPLSYLP